MITFVVAAALAVGYEPVAEVPLHKVPGPAFLIPCKVEAADLVAVVQLWVSADRGRKWELHEEISPDQQAFTFTAKKPGEYWFAPRIKKKDGKMLPAETSDLVATQRVAVATGSDAPEQPGKSIAKPAAADTAAELDEELTRVELELIRKEIKNLSELMELTPDAEDMFDRLRMRLRDLRERLRPDRDRSSSSTLSGLPPVSSPQVYPSLPPMVAPDDKLIPPSRDEVRILSPLVPLLATSSEDEVPTYKAPGSTFRIPCNFNAMPADVVGVELWSSLDGGKTWAKSGDITRDQRLFDFEAGKAGEYLFAPRLRYKDGSLSPHDRADLVPQLRVVVKVGSDAPSNPTSPPVKTDPLIPPSQVPTDPLIVAPKRALPAESSVPPLPSIPPSFGPREVTPITPAPPVAPPPRVRER